MIERDVVQAYGYLMFNAGLLRDKNIFGAGILHSAAEHLVNPLRECCRTVEMYLESKSCV